MTNLRWLSLIVMIAAVGHVWIPAEVRAQGSPFYQFARQEQAKAQNHLRESIRIAERSIKMIQSWQTPDDLKRAETTIVEAYRQLNEARDATQRSGGAMMQAQKFPDPMSSHLITIIDRARDAMRVAHANIAEAAAFENGREQHIAQALQHVMQSMQHNQTAQSLNF